MRTAALPDNFPARLPPRSTRCGIVALLLVMAGLWGEAAGGGEIDARELRRMLAERQAVLGIQTEFPSEPDSRRTGGYARRGASTSPVQVSTATASSMLWIALAVFLAVALLTWRQNLRPRGGGGKAEQREARNRLDGARARMHAVREESDVLAERGDYAAAMHVLLLNSVDEMRRRLGIGIAPSLTSREILAQSGLEEEARTCLGDIVRRVETSWFGPHLPGADDYARCRASFVALTGILGRGGRA